MTETFLVRGAALTGGDAVDLIIEGGTIVDIGTGLSRAGASIVDAGGLIALPGLVDLHTTALGHHDPPYRRLMRYDEAQADSRTLPPAAGPELRVSAGYGKPGVSPGFGPRPAS